MSVAAQTVSMPQATFIRLLVGITLALITALVVLGGIRRIARVASVMVPFMVGIYFIAVVYILIDHYQQVPAALQSIFSEAFNLRAGFGALIGTALIGARRAALVIDSGFVCTLTALALLVAGDFSGVDGVKGLEIAMQAFGNAIPYGEYILMLIVLCFGLSSLFSYSFYGNRCATYLFGERRARIHTWFFIITLILFAVVPLQAAVGLCDLLYAFMAIPTMITVLLLSNKVRSLTRSYFSH